MAKDFTGEQGVIITAGRTFDFTDETGAGADDGTPITKEKVMQMMAVFQHLMLDASYTHNGLAENAVTQTPGDTQYYDALVARMVAAINSESDIYPIAGKIPKRSPAEGELRALIDGAGADLYLSGGSADSKTILPNLGYLLRAIPVGTALPFCSATLPAGWLECNGAAISRTTYPLLFAAIGTTWGSGDGSTTFTLPDFRNRVLAGAYSDAPAGSALWLPTASGSGLPDLDVGEYEALPSVANRFFAGVKFMIRAL